MLLKLLHEVQLWLYGGVGRFFTRRGLVLTECHIYPNLRIVQKGANIIHSFSCFYFLYTDRVLSLQLSEDTTHNKKTMYNESNDPQKEARNRARTKETMDAAEGTAAGMLHAARNHILDGKCLEV